MFKDRLPKWREIRLNLSYLVYGEYFSDALRNTLTIVLPVGLLFFLGQAQAALGLGVGALLISLTDGPGHKAHKWITAANSISIFFFAALLISYSLVNFWLGAASLFVITFLCTMLAIFGSRLALTGTMAIILAIFVIGLQPHEPLLFSWYILLGGSWYYLVSLIQTLLRPYRSLHQAIFECISATAVFLRAKASAYDPEVPLDDCYRETIAMHIRVSEKQELMRTLLLSDRSAMKPENQKGRRLLHTALHLIDLYEQVTAIHYDYAFVRSSLDTQSSLNRIIRLIEILADELETIGGIFLLPPSQRKQSAGLTEFAVEIAQLKAVAAREGEGNAYILFKVIKNMEDIAVHIREIMSEGTLTRSQEGQKAESLPYTDFLSPKVFSPGSLKSHFSFRSAVFRFSLRLALLCLLAYLMTGFFHMGRYGYWLILTIVIVAKPRFGLTWKRNLERLSGTFAGVAIGLILVTLIAQQFLLLLLSSIFLLGFFTFNRIKYAISVMCITPMVIICLSIYNGGVNDIISERIYYTVLGCIMAFAAAYLFPVWEAAQLKSLIRSVLEANFSYLSKVQAEFWGAKPGIAEIKLARKNSYLKLARLAEGLQYTLLEPHMKKADLSGVHAIQILSYRINAIISSLALSAKSTMVVERSSQMGQEALDHLSYCIQGSISMEHGTSAAELNADPMIKEDDGAGLLSHQLGLLVTLSRQLRIYFK
ncbi:FUSC family protein [Pedobacter sp. GR22-6]|uniref:FUSC family protein n=1 Tax=Pedobacter sp. GR22-6 TaxID=3127957 RepID=UPI00307CCE9E